MGQREIARYYTLSDDDLKRIRRHRRDHNRLGYAVQLGLLRYPGWPFRPAEAVPVPMITYIAAQLGVTLRANIDETGLPVVITERGENRNQCEEQWSLFGFSHGFAYCGT